MPDTPTPVVYHLGRGFPGNTRIEDKCPCAQAPCGLAISDAEDFGCPQHDPLEAKTMRQMHTRDECPGKRNNGAN